jgi:hypothetical protein
VKGFKVRIISKNGERDYYDSIQRTGVDRSIVYVREPKVIRQSNTHSLDRLSEAVIGFCGKTYPAVYYLDYETAHPKKIIRPFYSLEELKIFVEENPKFQEHHYLSGYFTSPYSQWKRFQEHFDKYSRSTNDLMDTFLRYKVPIFLYHKYQDKLTINPILSAWEFYRVFDPWTAFQELSMYLSNVLVEPSKSIPKMSDVDLAEIKGFDKHSFRKDKAVK